MVGLLGAYELIRRRSRGARVKSPPLTKHKYAIVVLEKNIVYKGK